MKSIHCQLFIILLICPVYILSQVPFNTSPAWISTDIQDYSTGLALADLNQDGWLDFIVSNGNDMERQRLAVYYNDGTGNFSTTADWSSSDIDYLGHLDVGDINNDGYPDVAVSVYIGTNGFSEPGKVKLYLNNGGTLSSLPDWVSSDNMYTFSCAFGDPDGDGDLDLAVACGEAYSSIPNKSRIYFNNGGVLNSLPGWTSQSLLYSYDVTWADFDMDSDLDLVFANEFMANQIYENNGGLIGTTPVWSSTDADQHANSLHVADVNNDGFLDFAVSDNYQLGGNGKFKIYLNNNGIMSSLPYWTSALSSYGSGINLSDVDNDGDPDLIAGSWWNALRIYINNSGTFASDPQWVSSTNSVVEAIYCGDYDNNGCESFDYQFISDGTKKLFYLGDAPIQKISSVRINSTDLPLNSYCYDLESGWVNLSLVPLTNDTLTITAIISHNLDIAVSNWDPSVGNYIFKNLSPPIPVELVSFNAYFTNGYVSLCWTTATETNNNGFEVQRRLVESQSVFAGGEGNEDWMSLNFIQGFGTTTEKQSYTFTDKNVLPGIYQYRLKQIDFDGSSIFSNIVKVEVAIPDNYSLEQNYPNPFNPSTKISWQVPVGSLPDGKAGWQTLKVFDVLGNEVATLVDEEKSAGTYEFTWNASNLPSGVYFYRLKAGGFVQTRKMILIK